MSSRQRCRGWSRAVRLPAAGVEPSSVPQDAPGSRTGRDLRSPVQRRKRPTAPRTWLTARGIATCHQYTTSADRRAARHCLSRMVIHCPSRFRAIACPSTSSRRARKYRSGQFSHHSSMSSPIRCIRRLVGNFYRAVLITPSRISSHLSGATTTHPLDGKRTHARHESRGCDPLTRSRAAALATSRALL
jgi:hypothetical protein